LPSSFIAFSRANHVAKRASRLGKPRPCSFICAQQRIPARRMSYVCGGEKMNPTLLT